MVESPIRYTVMCSCGPENEHITVNNAILNTFLIKDQFSFTRLFKYTSILVYILSSLNKEASFMDGFSFCFVSHSSGIPSRSESVKAGRGFKSGQAFFDTA